MLNLTSFVHGQELQSIMTRWLMGRFMSEDCPRLKELMNFNNYLVTRYINETAQRLLSSMAGIGVSRFEARLKAELKDFIVLNPPYLTPRIEEVLSHYGKYPQDYYRHAPFHGVIYYAGERGHPDYLGHTRVKRTRRLSEKGARRTIDFIFERIKTQADILASERAARLGISKEQLITDPQTQLDEFVHAERRVIKSIRLGMLSEPGQAVDPSLALNDVAGIKVIAEDDRAHLVGEFVRSNPDIEMIEVEQHSGRYNATNLILRQRLDLERLASSPPGDEAVAVFARRGMDPCTVRERYAEFVRSADPHVQFEVIVSNYGEMIESELGRCMHEERVLDQRRLGEYHSSLAHNVRYLIEYMFTFTMSPKTHIDEIPIKLWERNMPDTFDDAVKNLWDLPLLPAL